MADNHTITCWECETRPAAWLMGEQTSRSLDWPFLCNVCKVSEEIRIELGETEWPAEFKITFDPLVHNQKEHTP